MDRIASLCFKIGSKLTQLDIHVGLLSCECNLASGTDTHTHTHTHIHTHVHVDTHIPTLWTRAILRKPGQ